MAVNREVPPIWTTGWTDILNTGTWRAQVPVHQRRPAPCHNACPVNGEIPVWIQLAREQRYQKAWQELAANNPFPAITGRICHHPCEKACNRGEYDGAVAVNALEQFIGDMALQENWKLPKPEAVLKERVAVVGGGPAGLACAYHLRLKGYGVTIFEARLELGGMLRYGIPQYRLPKDIVDREIERLLELDIEVKRGYKVEAAELANLEREYSSVFLALGAQTSKGLPQFPRDDSRVIDGLDFLERVNRGEDTGIGKEVVVIGGGSVAMDVARTARRLGASVKVMALESREILPAQPDEVEEALEENISLLSGSMAQEVSTAGEKIKMSCIQVTLDPSAPVGVLKPIIQPGTEFDLAADNVILAVGQTTELAGWENLVTITDAMFSVGEDFAASRQGVFAGGDAAGLDRYVSAAIGQGKKAAAGIARYLGGSALEVQQSAEQVAFQDINTFYFPLADREERGTAPVEQRAVDFSEVRSGFTSEQAQGQTERCFSCGSCIQCDNCFYFCPDMAVVKDSSLEEHYRVLDQYCKGCGCCVEECPRGAVVLKEETR